MKKQAGFTLVEVIVGMLVTMLIMGALVSLFSSSVKSELSGFKQQEVYAQARAAVNDLKTTLRYANAAAVFYDTSDNKISSPTYDNTKIASKVEYTATIYNSSTAKNESVKITVEWLPNSNKKLLRIGRSIDGVAQPDEQFPKDVSNSSFKGDGTDFPLIINETDSLLYHINLPYQYAFAGSGNKSDALVTDVLKGAEAVDGSGVPPILLTGGKLEFASTNGKIRTETEDVTLVLKAQEAAGLNNGNWSSSKFKVLTNNSSIKNNSGKIDLVDSYDGLDLDGVISKYSRIEGSNAYTFPATINPNPQELKTYPSFSIDEAKEVGKVLWNSGIGAVTINGTNAVFSEDKIFLDGDNVSFALENGKANGALILYSKSQISLDDLTIPSNIAVLICADSQVTITNCTLNNCIVLAKGGNCKIEKSNIYGMVESAGLALQIEGKCTFGSFKGDPTAIEVFDKYFDVN